MKKNLKNFWIAITAMIMIVIFIMAGVTATMMVYDYFDALWLLMGALLALLGAGVRVLMYLIMKS